LSKVVQGFDFDDADGLILEDFSNEFKPKQQALINKEALQDELQEKEKEIRKL